MSRFTASTDIQQVKPEDVPRFTDQAFQAIAEILNGGIDFETNIKCKILSVTFATANIQQAVSHGLGRVPQGYLVISSSAATSIYNGSSGSSSDVINLAATAPATVGLIVF